MSSLAQTVIGKVGNSDRLRVQQLNTVAADVVTQLAEGSSALCRRRFKLFGNVNVAEVVLTAQVIDREPLHFGDSLVVRQCDREIFVEVAFQDVGSKNDESLKRRFGSWPNSTHFPNSSGTMNP